MPVIIIEHPKFRKSIKRLPSVVKVKVANFIKDLPNYPNVKDAAKIRQLKGYIPIRRRVRWGMYRLVFIDQRMTEEELEAIEIAEIPENDIKINEEQDDQLDQETDENTGEDTDTSEIENEIQGCLITLLYVRKREDAYKKR